MQNEPTDHDSKEPLKDAEDYSEAELDELHYDMSDVPIYYEHG
jgi:hypothetical protein